MKFFNQIASFALLFYFTPRLILSTSSEFTLPVIKTLGARWKFLNSDNTTIIGKVSHMQLTMLCTSTYPIKWSVQGFMAKGKTFRAGYPTATITPEGKLLYLLEGWEVFQIPTTVKATCAHFNNASIASSIHIIVDDMDSGRLILKNITMVGKQTLIPCLTTDPSGLVELFKDVNGAYEKIENTSYDPTLGFTLNEPQTGNFMCRGASNNKTIVIDDPYEVQPFEQSKVWLTDETVSIKCNSNGEIETNLVTAHDNNTKLQETSQSLILYKMPTNRTVFHCLNSQRKLKNVLYYSVADAPRLRLDNKFGEMECLTTAKNKSVSAVRCLNPNDCELLKGCFDDEICHTKTNIYQPARTGDELCRIVNYDCITIKYSFYNGLLECAVANKIRNKIFHFFTGLRLIKYLNWRDAPTDHLVRMDETPPLVYANDSTTFYCEAIKFLFADSFHFNITFSNGSQIRLVEGVDYKNVAKEIIETRKVADFNILSGIKIFLPVDAVKLTCYVFLMTEPMHIVATRNFSVKYLSPPLVDRKEVNVHLTRGINGQLNCKSSGNPTPEIKWTRKNSSVSDDSTFETKVTSDGEAILQFTNIVSNSDEGEYICTSSNRVGNDTVTFSVTVLEPRETALYGIIFATFVVILLLALFALYFWRQHTIALNMIRQLTEEEIDEFINGNRDMWLLNIANQQQNIDYMPYNNEYEIPVAKITFDQSSLLGSGEYGIVVTAKLDNKTVAVKSTKPAADVVYFKSLLSELKIMMFIGHHEHIVKFIGSNTENIKERKIYILFELCSLGNLNAYLHESRFSEPGEGILINYESSRHAVSLHVMLRWSYQIACAMEYLAKKNIVHADLATRNILLTDNQVAKLSDFGLSLKLYSDSNYGRNQQTRLPFRWMAIESLKHLKFSTETDVWSYGITIWEIFSLGEVPYPQESWNNHFSDKLVEGMRLQKPKHCPEDVYNFVMKSCWNEVPSQRPKFSILVDFFIRHLNNPLADFKETPSDFMNENRSPPPARQRVMTHYTKLSIDNNSLCASYANL